MGLFSLADLRGATVRRMSELVNRFPLARDERGQWLQIPADARGWIVRRKQPGRGAPALVRIGGEPLQLDLATSYEQFVDAVDGAPATYRLDLVDQYGNLIPGAPSAFTEIGNGTAYPNGVDPVPILLATVEKQGAQLIEAMKLLSAQNAALHTQLAAQASQMMAVKLPPPAMPRNALPPPSADVVNVDDGRIHFSVLALEGLKAVQAVAQAVGGEAPSQLTQLLGTLAGAMGGGPPLGGAPPSPFSPPMGPPPAGPMGPPPGAAAPPFVPPAPTGPIGPPPGVAPPFVPPVPGAAPPTAPPFAAGAPPPHVDAAAPVESLDAGTDAPHVKCADSPAVSVSAPGAWYPVGPPATAAPPSPTPSARSGPPPVLAPGAS